MDASELRDGDMVRVPGAGDVLLVEGLDAAGGIAGIEGLDAAGATVVDLGAFRRDAGPGAYRWQLLRRGVPTGRRRPNLWGRAALPPPVMRSAWTGRAALPPLAMRSAWTGRAALPPLAPVVPIRPLAMPMPTAPSPAAAAAPPPTPAPTQGSAPVVAPPPAPPPDAPEPDAPAADGDVVEIEGYGTPVLLVEGLASITGRAVAPVYASADDLGTDRYALSAVDGHPMVFVSGIAGLGELVAADLDVVRGTDLGSTFAQRSARRVKKLGRQFRNTVGNALMMAGGVVTGNDRMIARAGRNMADGVVTVASDIVDEARKRGRKSAALVPAGAQLGPAPGLVLAAATGDVPPGGADAAGDQKQSNMPLIVGGVAVLVVGGVAAAYAMSKRKAA